MRQPPVPSTGNKLRRFLPWIVGSAQQPSDDGMMAVVCPAGPSRRRLSHRREGSNRCHPWGVGTAPDRRDIRHKARAERCSCDHARWRAKPRHAGIKANDAKRPRYSCGAVCEARAREAANLSSRPKPCGSIASLLFTLAGRETSFAASSGSRPSKDIRTHRVACHGWRAPSPICSNLSFQYTQPSGLVTVTLQLSNCDLYHGNCIHELVLIWSGRNRQRENRP